MANFFGVVCSNRFAVANYFTDTVEHSAADMQQDMRYNSLRNTAPSTKDEPAPPGKFRGLVA